MEAEWALLWVIGKVEALGLPIRQCDTRRLVDEIIPALGSDIEPFLATAVLRSPGVLLAEDDRVYDLWCRWHAARRIGDPLPEDLDEAVLYQRVVTVGNALTGVPPCRTVRAELPHTAPTSGAWRRSGRSDARAGPEPEETRSRRSARTAPTTVGASGSGAEARAANCGPSPVGTYSG